MTYIQIPFTIDPNIVAAIFKCPVCREFHVDRGIWAVKAHSIHLCEYCGHEWFHSGWYNSRRGVEPTLWQRFIFWLKFESFRS